jgi:hypothetical protein
MRNDRASDFTLVQEHGVGWQARKVAREHLEADLARVEDLAANAPTDKLRALYAGMAIDRRLQLENLNRG